MGNRMDFDDRNDLETQTTTREAQAARQRAPAIRIDKSAVSPPSATPIYCPGPLLSDEPSPLTQHHRSLSNEERPLLSSTLEPTLTAPPNLLAVPDSSSRSGSLDHLSVTSYDGDTLVTTPTLSIHSSSKGQSHKLMSSLDLSVEQGNEDRLIPDPGTEHHFHVEDNPFAFSPGQLSKLFNPTSLSAFCALGGLQGIVLGLRTDSSTGLSLDETVLDGNVHIEDVTTSATRSAFLDSQLLFRSTRNPSTTAAPVHHTSSELYADRKRVFGTGRLPERKSKTLLHIMWLAFNDKVLIILTVVACISLALGLYQDFGSSSRLDGPKVRWVEGVTIMVAVALVVVVGSVNDYQKEQQFLKLSKKKADRLVEVIRSGKLQQISVYDVLAGDVLHLQPGDLVPADGIFISGHNIRCDESSVTGESDQKKKVPGSEVINQMRAAVSTNQIDPFIISGSKVLEGTGTYLVTGVGLHSSYGKLIVATTDDTEAAPTPLQSKLNVMAEQITRWGCAIALLLFIVLFCKFLVQLKTNPGAPAQKAQDFLQIVIVTITIIVIAVPEGLPLAVTLALAFAMTKMLKDHNLVRVLSSCETMGNATAICSDKTGTLTMNKMTVVAGTLGTDRQFGVSGAVDNQDASDAEETAMSNSVPIPMSRLSSLLSQDIKDLFLQSIAINSTAFESNENGELTFIGSKTETALLLFAKWYLGMRPISEEHANADVVQIFPFDSGRKCMATVVRLFDGTYRMYVKGAPEILLEKCTQIIADTSGPVTGTKLTKGHYNSIIRTTNKYASNSLRTIGIIYRDLEYWPPYGAKTLEDDSREAVLEDVLEEMVFLGVVGIHDPLRPGVKNAVERCQHAGVFVRMVTGDNKGTAQAIAKECGIYTDGIILEGPAFRKLSPVEMDRTIPKLQVLARSSPEDKRILVKRLKELGEVVAVTGDGTNDGPALRAADVGFSMGISGTEVAKEASSIILMDDNFASIIKALEWGRAVNDSVKKFLQFQLTVNITAVGLTFVSAISNPNEEPILTPVQLLWVNLIMDTFAALALATDPPTPSVLDRKPDPKSSRLITLNMWKMIIGQAIYQLIVTLVLDFRGNEILGYTTEFEKSRLETLVFNIYVWMQVFNQLNNRRLDDKLNVFEGISRNWFFIGINIITIIGQVLIVFLGSSALSTVRLDSTQWAISLFLGALSLPVAILIRLIPDDFIRKLLPARLSKRPTTYDTIPSDDRFEWNPALQDVRDQLFFFKTIRGGFHTFPSTKKQPQQIAHTSDYRESRHAAPDNHVNGNGTASPRHRLERSRSRSSTALRPAAVMAGIIAGSIAGWSPTPRSNENANGDDSPNERTRLLG